MAFVLPGEVYKCHWRGTTIAVKVLTDQAMNEETMAEFRTGAPPPPFPAATFACAVWI